MAVGDMTILVFGHKIPVACRDKDIRVPFEPKRSEYETGIRVGTHDFTVMAKSIIDYNQGAFGACIGIRLFIEYGHLREYIDLDHRFIEEMYSSPKNLDIRICRVFNFSAGLMCHLIQHGHAKE